MPTEYSQLPASAAESGAGNSWSNFANITASDNAYVTATLDQTNDTKLLVATMPTWSGILPTNLSITGYKISIEASGVRGKGSTSDAGPNDIQLVHNGSPVGTAGDLAGFTNFPNAGGETTIEYGGDSNLLGASLTPAQIIADGLGCQFRAAHAAGTGNFNVSIDTATLAIYGNLIASFGLRTFRKCKFAVRLSRFLTK